jgi:hypothetical protein
MVNNRPDPSNCASVNGPRTGGESEPHRKLPGDRWIQVDRLLGATVRTGIPNRLDRDAIPQRDAPVRGDSERECLAACLTLDLPTDGRIEGGLARLDQAALRLFGDVIESGTAHAPAVRWLSGQDQRNGPLSL